LNNREETPNVSTLDIVQTSDSKVESKNTTNWEILVKELLNEVNLLKEEVRALKSNIQSSSLQTNKEIDDMVTSMHIVVNSRATLLSNQSVINDDIRSSKDSIASNDSNYDDDGNIIDTRLIKKLHSMNPQISTDLNDQSS